jgi:hypothetical protein
VKLTSFLAYVVSNVVQSLSDDSSKRFQGFETARQILNSQVSGELDIGILKRLALYLAFAGYGISSQPALRVDTATDQGSFQGLVHVSFY